MNEGYPRLEKQKRLYPTRQHGGNHSLNASTTARWQQSPVTSNTSNPNNPCGAANGVVHFSGIVGSFNNYENGSQDFSVATINSSRIRNSFNNHSSSSQTLRGERIRQVDDYGISGEFNNGDCDSVSYPWAVTTESPNPNHSGIHSSFQNYGSGTQNRDGLKIKSRYTRWSFNAQLNNTIYNMAPLFMGNNLEL
ncbi:hypothetical protein E2542_SST16726 [Spatholobus suberectus]|nr:hypothetical protein E2542_SST16726 [Spatholobus suberectus]